MVYFIKIDRNISYVTLTFYLCNCKPSLDTEYRPSNFINFYIWEFISLRSTCESEKIYTMRRKLRLLVIWTAIVKYCVTCVYIFPSILSCLSSGQNSLKSITMKYCVIRISFNMFPSILSCLTCGQLLIN